MSCEVVSSSDVRENEVKSFASMMAVALKLLLNHGSTVEPSVVTTPHKCSPPQ